MADLPPSPPPWICHRILHWLFSSCWWMKSFSSALGVKKRITICPQIKLSFVFAPVILVWRFQDIRNCKFHDYLIISIVSCFSLSCDPIGRKIENFEHGSECLHILRVTLLKLNEILAVATCMAITVLLFSRCAMIIGCYYHDGGHSFGWASLLKG